MSKVNELNNSVEEKAYQVSLRGQYKVWRGFEVESVEKECESLETSLIQWTVPMMYVHMRRVFGQGRKRSEWWNEEVGGAVSEKTRVFYKWPQRRDIVTNDRYRAQRVVVKQSKL